MISKHNSLFRDAIAYNKEVAPLVNKALEVITPLKTLELFNNIRPDEVRNLDVTFNFIRATSILDLASHFIIYSVSMMKFVKSCNLILPASTSYLTKLPLKLR